MNLELIEQEAVAYLQQVSNPLTPLRNLVRHLRTGDKFAGFDEQELRRFLRNHELFRVIEPPFSDAEEGLGLASEPLIILEARVPSAQDLARMMETELAQLGEALSQALEQATTGGHAKQVEDLHSLLARVETLKARLENGLRRDNDATTPDASD